MIPQTPVINRTQLNASGLSNNGMGKFIPNTPATTPKIATTKVAVVSSSSNWISWFRTLSCQTKETKTLLISKFRKFRGLCVEKNIRHIFQFYGNSTNRLAAGHKRGLIHSRLFWWILSRDLSIGTSFYRTPFLFQNNNNLAGDLSVNSLGTGFWGHTHLKGAHTPFMCTFAPNNLSRAIVVVCIT